MLNLVKSILFIIQNINNRIAIFVKAYNIIIYLIFAVFLIPFVGGFIHEFADITYFKYYTFGLSLKDFFGIWISIFGAIGLLYNIRISGKRLTNQQIQINSQSKSERDSRFAKGIELLGNPISSARTGGAYILYFLAKEYPEEYTKTVFDILCAHVRSITEDEMYKKSHHKVPSTEIQTIIDLLFKDKDGTYIFNGLDANLANAFLHGINISNGYLRKANLSYSDFSGSYLRNMIFDESLIYNTLFSGAVLINNSFKNSIGIIGDFNFSSLDNSNFENSLFTKDTTFIGANISDANFAKTELCGVRFIGAKITGASFNQAFIYKTNFSGVNMNSADFSSACCELEIDKRVYTDLESCELETRISFNYFEEIIDLTIFDTLCLPNIKRVRKLTDNRKLQAPHVYLRATNVPESTKPVTKT